MNGEIRYFSMFTGVGGFELGIERANDFKPLSEIEQNKQRGNGSTNEQGTLLRSGRKSTLSCIGFSEIDKYSCQLLKNKFPGIKNYGDATKINPEELPDFDMLCGGFPCQAFSIAGKRKGFSDTRGTLFFDIARILEVKRPKIVLLENVKGLLNHEKGKTFRKIIQTLSELGYVVQWMVLNSKFFGVPQNRERVFIIGNLRGEPRSEILPFRGSSEEIGQVCNTIKAGYYKKGYDSPVIQQLNQPTHSNNRIYGKGGISPALTTAHGGNSQPKIRAVLTPDRPEKRQNGRRFKEPGESSFTRTWQDIHGISDGVRIRRLTPLECERLQGFPDNWTEGFSDTQRYNMMGNAVSVNVIRAIIMKMFK